MQTCKLAAIVGRYQLMLFSHNNNLFSWRLSIIHKGIYYCNIMGLHPWILCGDKSVILYVWRSADAVLVKSLKAQGACIIGK